MKKKLIIAAAAAGVAAAAVPAMALENEFHGMYKFMGYQTNAFDGGSKTMVVKDAPSRFFAEQRARLQYTAKANDSLKLVTHFELDTRFGGFNSKVDPYKGTLAGNDSGQLDADQLTLETKNIYLDVTCPITGTNFKVGMQPWADAYNSIFLLADMTGVYATKGFGPVTASLGWFRYADDGTVGQKTQTSIASTTQTTSTSAVEPAGKKTNDLIVADVKYAVNKDIKAGVSYYNIQNDGGNTTAPAVELLHMVGANADLTFGPANIKPFVAYQFGDVTKTVDLSAFLAGVTSKVKVGPGAVNFSAIYLSGDDNTADTKAKDFKIVTANTSYFNAANMWLLVRSGQAVNSSTSLVNNDLTVGGRGLFGVFAGYEGTADKLFYNANVGYAQAAKAAGSEKKSLGTEINAQVGYKLYDNLSASAAVAYAILGKGLDSNTAAERLPASATAKFGGADADNSYAVNLQLSYTF